MKPFENAAAVAAPQDGNHVLPVNQSCFQAQPIATPTGFEGNAVSLSALLNCDQEVPLQPIATNSTALDAQLAERKAEVQRMAAQSAAQPVSVAYDGSLAGLSQLLAQSLSTVMHPEMGCVDYPRIRELLRHVCSVLVAHEASPEGVACFTSSVSRSLPSLDSIYDMEQLNALVADEGFNTASMYQVDAIPLPRLLAELKAGLDEQAFAGLVQAARDKSVIQELNSVGKVQWPILKKQVEAAKTNKHVKQAQKDLQVIVDELAQEENPQRQYERVYSEDVIGLIAELPELPRSVAMEQITGLCETVTKRELTKAVDHQRSERIALRIESKPRDRKLIKLPMNDRDLLAASLEGLAEYQREKKEAFVMSGKLARIIRDEGGKPRIELLLKKDQASHLLSESIDYFKKGNRGGYAEWTPSDKLVGDVMSIGEYPLPRLKGITQIPILRNDGTVVTTPGYDGETGLYYAPPLNFDLPGIPDEPTEEDVAQAVQFIDRELFADFPFVSDADKANAWAELLTVFLRDHIDGCVPAILHDAPSAGTGKSLLARLTSVVASGNDAGLLPQPENEAEMRKVLTAELINGRQLIVLDNYDGKLDSPSLCKMITSREHQDRVLGKSVTVTVPVNAVPIITMNNCQVGGDMCRRVVLIRMDAKRAKPWERDSHKFHHTDLIGWVKQHRSEVVGALLTIVSGWLKAGSPAPSNPRSFGNFEEWVDVIGGVLEFAGISGFLENMDVIAKLVDSDTPQIEGFLFELYAHIRKSPLTPLDQTASQWKEFIDRAGDNLQNLLPDELGIAFESSQPGLTRTLGRWFKRNKDRRFGEHGLRIEEAGKHRNSIVWRLTFDSEPKVNGLFIRSADGASQRLGSAQPLDQDVTPPIYPMKNPGF